MRIQQLGLAVALVATATLSAQTATFTAYGTGCGTCRTSCLSANWGQTFSSSAGASANFAILFNSGSKDLLVCGVELFCARSSGPTTFAVSIWDRNASSGQPNNSLASGTMPVTATPQANKATFKNKLLILKANTDYFVVLDNRVGLRLPIMSTGTLQTHYWNGPPSWRGPFTSARWNYRILCLPYVTPKLSNTGLPSIGKSFSIDLSNAAANAKALWAVGVKQTALDLGPAGAPSCILLTEPLSVLPVNADAMGKAAVPLTVPNDQSLISLSFFNQFAVIDPSTNALGLIFSNGGAGKVGT